MATCCIGTKTKERFAGAEETYCIEALMQDGKGITSWYFSFFRSNFAKAFDVKFTTKGNKNMFGQLHGEFYSLNGSISYDTQMIMA